MSSLSVIDRQISATENTLDGLGLQLKAKRNEIERLALSLTHLYDYMEEYKLTKSNHLTPKIVYATWKEKRPEVWRFQDLEEVQSPINNDQLVNTIRNLKEKIREEKQALVRLKKNIVTYENELHYLQFERKRKLS